MQHQDATEQPGERPTREQIAQAVERAKRHLSAQWEERANYERSVFHRLFIYRVNAWPIPLEFVEPLPGWPGWWVAGEVLRIGDDRAVYNVWVEPTTMRVKTRRVPMC